MGEKNKNPKIIKKMAKMLNKSSISKKNIIMLLNAFHLGLPWGLLILVLLGPQWLALACIAFIILSLLSCLVLQGSWLTMLTRELSGTEDNVVDPYIEILRMEPNESNRKKMIWVLGFWFIVVIGGIFYVRFYAGNNIIKKALSDELGVKDVVNFVRGDN